MSFVQPQPLATYAVRVLGHKREWNIITETGGRLERFTGSKRAAEKRAKALQAQRVGITLFTQEVKS